MFVDCHAVIPPNKFHAWFLECFLVSNSSRIQLYCVCLYVCVGCALAIKKLDLITRPPGNSSRIQFYEVKFQNIQGR